MRLTTKPGESLTVIAVLPVASANALAAAIVWSLVRVAAHDLDQRHHRHGVEEVDADEALGAGDERRQLAHRETRRVGGDDGVGTQRRVRLLEEALLELHRLRRRLDEQVGVGAGGHVGARGDAGQGGVAGGGFHAALLDQPAEALLDAGHAAGDELVGDVDHDDVEPATADTWTMPAPIWPAPATRILLTLTLVLLVVTARVAGQVTTRDDVVRGREGQCYRRPRDGVHATAVRAASRERRRPERQDRPGPVTIPA